MSADDATKAEPEIVIQQEVTEGAPSDSTKDSHPDKKATTSDAAGTVFAVLFWLVIVAVGAFWYLHHDRADVLLDVTPGTNILVSGQVFIGGAPAENGRVHVVVSDGEKRYLASAVMEVKDGRFNRDQALATLASDKEGICVVATYYGVVKNKDVNEKIEGLARAYVNAPTPLSSNQVAWIVGSVFGFNLLLIFLFTGELTQFKARALFAVTYLMTFLSLAVPICVTVFVSTNRYLVETMEKAPIGLVHGRADGMKDDGWLLNMGGSVQRSDADAPGAAATPKPVVDENGLPAPDTSTGAATDTRPRAAGVRTVFAGGLAVPFYVVMLAMLGAGINMTRQVPKIQATYDQKITPRTESVLLAVLHAPGAIFRKTAVTDPKEREAAAYIRKELIDSYMYLLAAPFLAIAVYYLLQVVATTTATPVLVVMAFATGMISDKIVLSIMTLAEKTLGGASPEPETKPTSQTLVVGTADAIDAAAQAATAKPGDPDSKAQVATEAATALKALASKVVAEADEPAAPLLKGTENGTNGNGRQNETNTDHVR
jgi:hypothetical protein